MSCSHGAVRRPSFRPTGHRSASWTDSSRGEPVATIFVIRVSSFLRHSSFGFRHFKIFRSNDRNLRRARTFPNGIVAPLLPCCPRGTTSKENEWWRVSARGSNSHSLDRTAICLVGPVIRFLVFSLSFPFGQTRRRNAIPFTQAICEVEPLKLHQWSFAIGVIADRSVRLRKRDSELSSCRAIQ